MKIRFRLSLWYVFVTLGILSVFSLGTYVGMRHLLFRALEREQELIARAVERSYNPATKSFQNLNATPDQLNPRISGNYVVIYNSVQERVYQSPLANSVALEIPLTTERRHTSIAVLKMQPPASGQTSRPGEVKFHTSSRKLFYQNEPVGWVNFAASMADIEASMHSLLKTLLFGIVLATALIGGGSFLLTDQALRPVARITEKAKQISSTTLTERVEVVNKSDELGQLATVLNGLLDRLQQAFDSQKQFMADAAHELKTPLAILRTHWEDELNNPGLPLDTKEKLVKDIETITRLSRLINNLMLLSRTELRQAEQAQSVRLDELLQEAISDTTVLAEMKRQNVEISHLDTITIKGNRDRLYQLIFNLIDNAIKYTPEAGEISLSLRKEDKIAVLEVADNGIGIAQEHLPRLFGRFYRVNKDRSRQSGGSGLGLAICKLIAERHGGSISAASAVGTGSIFTVQLPLEMTAD